MYQLFGIPNCDTVKKCKKLLEDKGLDYELVNFKKTPPTEKDINRWKKFLGDLPVNKRGTTFRKIKEEFESASEKEQVKILVENSSAIKRPALEKDGKTLAIGLDKEVYESL